MVVFERHHRLPHIGVGRFLLPSGEIIFILYIMEVGQGSRSLERRGGYDLFVFRVPDRTCFNSISMLFCILLLVCFIYSIMSFLFISCVYFCYKLYVLSSCFVCSVKSFHTLLPICFSSYDSSFHMKFHVYRCFEIYVLPCCYVSYIMLLCFQHLRLSAESANHSVIFLSQQIS